MKVVILNAGPRKNSSTARLLLEAKRGVESARGEAQYVELFDLAFSGCRSCLACKRRDLAEPCRCYWRDGLSPVLEQVLAADRLIVGSPIYYGEPTGAFRSFMERLTFPALSYNDYSSLFKGRVDVDIFLTMNASLAFYEKAYAQRLAEYFSPLRMLGGEVRLIPVCDTLQVEDYSKYEMRGFSEEHKRGVYATEFPRELERAYLIGAGK